MTDTHTPPPWGYSKLGNDADQWAMYDESGRTIGLSYHGEPNAQLMAAAPEMLEALQAADKWIKETIANCEEALTLSSLPFNNPMETPRVVQDIITKATGSG